jgi:predicted ATPase
MFPDTIKLQRYRCFAEEQTLPVRRLTLIYGENNTGKSALVRLLPLLADSCEPRSPSPLSTRSKAMRDGSLRNLFSNRARRDMALELGWGKESVRYVFAVEDEGDRDRGVIERCELRLRGETIAAATRTLSSGAPDGATHTWTFADGTPTVQGAFRGLVPVTDGNTPPQLLAAWNARMSKLAGAVQWLHARRAPLPTSDTRQAGDIWLLDPDGRDVIQLLSAQPTVAARVGDWFGKHEKAVFAVSSDLRSTEASLTLTIPPGASFNLVDGSEGLQFTVPVLAALGVLASEALGAPSVLALEEPEGHLHGRLQRALAEEIIDVVERTPSARVIIETHSPIFLTAMQLAVARARRAPPRDGALPLRAGDVALCLAERDGAACSLRTVTLDDGGAPTSGEFVDFFSEEHTITLDLQREREG